MDEIYPDATTNKSLMRVDTTNFTLVIELWPPYFYCRLLFRRMVKHWWQRRTRGFDDSEVWSFDDTLTHYILPRLKRFKQVSMSYPPMYDTHQEWLDDIQIMIDTFEFLASEESDMCMDEGKWKEIDEGLELFKERYHNLWS